METIVLNQETGLLAIGPYTIHPRLTFTELETSYPDLNRQIVNAGDVVLGRSYRLPRFEFLDQQIDATLMFYDRFVDGILVRCIVEDVSGDDEEAYLYEMVGWTRRVKRWLSAEFGPPHRTKPPVLLDEDRWLSREAIGYLDWWIYKPLWGEFGYSFHWETEASLHVHFDKHYQNRDWDGLRDQSRYWAQQTHWQPETAAKNQPLVEAAINVLSANFDYNALRVFVNRDLRGLIFDLPQWSTMAVVEIRPDHPKKPYRITRHDTVRKDYATLENLVKTLRVFLETEKL